MNVLGIDLETTGLDAAKDRIIEMACVLWDVEEQRPVHMMSHLLDISPMTVPAEIERFTGIQNSDLEKFGVSELDALIEMDRLAVHADFLVAHNASFDRGFLYAALKRHDKPSDYSWIDTVHDIPYPSTIGSKKLTYLACEHKFINPFPHRALFDVMTMMEVFKNYPIDEILRLQESPVRKLVAKVSFEEKDKAKNMGFRWDNKSRVWYKEMKEILIEQTEFPFEVSLQ